MEEQCPAYLIQIQPEDWEKTPASVKKLVEEMQGKRILSIKGILANLLKLVAIIFHGVFLAIGQKPTLSL
jgi:hypothetical protein